MLAGFGKPCARLANSDSTCSVTASLRSILQPAAPGPARLGSRPHRTAPHRTAPHRTAPAAAQRRGAAARRALSSVAVLKPQEPLRQNSAPLSPSPRARGNGGGRPAARPAGGGDGGGLRRRSMRGPQRAWGAAAAVTGRPCTLPARG